MSRQRQVVLYFVLTFLGTWGIVALMVLAPDLATRLFGTEGTSNPLFYLAVYVPSVLGIILTAVFDGKAGLASFAARLNPLRFNPIWLLVVLVGFPLVWAAAGLIAGESLAFPGVVAALVLLAKSLIFDPGPVGEEFGWRGFALPRLLERFTPLWASIILGTVWGLWHLPVLINPAYPQYGTGITRFVLGTIAMAVAMTWIHLGTKGSILLAIFFHLTVNASKGLVGVSLSSFMRGTAVVAILIVLIQWRRQIVARPTIAP